MTKRWTKRFVNDLFVDTSAFFALANLADNHHAEAVAAFESSVGHDDLKTSDHVVVETWYLIRSRLGRNAAMRFWDGFDGGVITVVGATAEDFRRGREIAQASSDQTFSIVDCTSFALIERLRIRRAFAFDRHFRIVRLGRRRDLALVIVPH
jgi:predicted nucleic acid-binding protein